MAKFCHTHRSLLGFLSDYHQNTTTASEGQLYGFQSVNTIKETQGSQPQSMLQLYIHMYFMLTLFWLTNGITPC